MINWLTANKLSLNEDKTEFLVFKGRARKRTANSQKISINGMIKEEVSASTYLGVVIDNRLNFIEHMKHLKIKLKKGTSMIAKLRHFVSSKYLHMVYNAHVESHLSYGSTVWTSGAKHYVQKIKNSQKQALSLLSFQHFDKNSDQIFKDTKCLSVIDLANLNTCKMIWQYRHLPHSDFLNFIFEESSVIVNPINDGKYIVPHRKYNNSQQAFCYNGVKNWNRQPYKIKNAPNLTAFKKCMKASLLQ